MQEKGQIWKAMRPRDKYLPLSVQESTNWQP